MLTHVSKKFLIFRRLVLGSNIAGSDVVVLKKEL
jgi:hypothetical protein